MLAAAIFLNFLCDAPGSALYVYCDYDHIWVMYVGVKNPTLEMRALKKLEFRTERVGVPFCWEA